MKNRIVRPLISLNAMMVFWVLGYFVAIPAWQTLESPDNWLKVHSVRISSTFVGNDPHMYVTRDLNLEKPTRGIWVAKVTDKWNRVVCSATGTALYEPKANLPPYSDFNLFSWWLETGERGPQSVCRKWPLPAGKYCVQTHWEFFPRNYPVSKQVDAPIGCFLYLDRPWYLG